MILTGTSTEIHSNIYFMKPAKGKIPQRIYSSSSLKNPDQQSDILFYHAFSGCDTTSAIFNKGKLKVTSLLHKHPSLRASISVFRNINTTSDEVSQAGENVFIALYGGTNSTSLNDVRYEFYGRSITKSKFNLACLPPTSDAATQHSMRTYHQVQKWIGNNLPPENWGWKQSPSGLIPIKALQEPAPPELLKLISCRCEKGCEKRCGCRKAGLKCTDICFSCHGRACSNSKSIDYDESETDDDHEAEKEQWASQSNKLGQPIDCDILEEELQYDSDE